MTQPKTSLERHIQTGIQVLLTGAVGWMAMTTQETSEEIARMSVEITHLKQAVQELKDAGRGAYTDHQAARDHEGLQRQIDALGKRVERLEGR